MKPFPHSSVSRRDPSLIPRVNQLLSGKGLLILLMCGFLKVQRICASPPAIPVHSNVRKEDAAPVVAVPAAVKSTKEQIQQWIMQLASHRRVIRHAAAENLLAAGDAAVPEMKKALTGLTTPEMRRLLRQGLGKIARADLLRGPLITLDADHENCRTALIEILQQLRRPLPPLPAWLFQEQTHKTVTLHLKKVPFWHAMADYAAQSGISPTTLWNGGASTAFGLGVPGLIYPNCPRYFYGGFMVELTGIGYSRYANMLKKGYPIESSFQVNLELLAEPDMPMAAIAGKADLTKAVDSSGKSLIDPHSYESVAHESNQAQWEFLYDPTMRHPPGVTDTISRLNGFFTVYLVAKKSKLIFTPPWNSKMSKTAAGLTFTIQQVKQKSPGYYSVLVVGRSRQWPATGQLMPHSVQVALHALTGTMRSVELLDSKGHAYACDSSGSNETGRFKGYYDFSAFGPGIGPPAKVIVIVATRLTKIHVPFEFRNIPLP